jgi:hypothetical protein
MRVEQEAVYNDRPVIIVTGWDNPLQGWFMTIEPAEDGNPDANEESGMIYSNLDDEDIPLPGLTRNLEHYKRRLREMKIEVPANYFDVVLAKND